MAEQNTGLKKILTLPKFYLLLQWILGSEKFFHGIVKDHVKPTSDIKILDIGCGPGSLLKYMPDVDYEGFDMNPQYIKFAEKDFGTRPKTRFYCQRVSQETIDTEQKYDIILAIGLLHHLDDDEAEHLFQLAKSRLNPGGRFITADCCFTKQHPFARFMISNDRGQNVRQPEGYKQLAHTAFDEVDMQVRHDLMNIPYTHTILESRV